MLTARHLWLLAHRSVQEFADDNCTQMAAAISYYVLFSLFPLLIFAVGVLGIVLQDSDVQQQLIDEVVAFFPVDEDGEQDVTDTIEGLAGISSGALGVFGLIGMAWSGSAMFGVIRRSLNIAFDLEGKRPLVRQKLMDFAIMGMLAAIFLASIAVTTTLRIAQQASDDIPGLGSTAEEMGLAWSVAAFLVPVAVSFSAFVMLYWAGPATHVKVRQVLPGAALAAVLFEVAKVSFGFYLENFSNYDFVFGSLGAVVAFLFWVFISANIMLLGAEVAAEYPRVMRGDYDKPPSTEAGAPLQERAWRVVRGLFVHETPRPDERGEEPRG